MALRAEKARAFVYGTHIEACLIFAGKDYLWSGVPTRWSTWEGSTYTSKYMTKQKKPARDKLLKFYSKMSFLV